MGTGTFRQRAGNRKVKVVYSRISRSRLRRSTPSICAHSDDIRHLFLRNYYTDAQSVPRGLGLQEYFLSIRRIEEGKLYVMPCDGLNLEKQTRVEAVRPVYGSDDALMLWHHIFTVVLKSIGFQRALIEACLYFLYSSCGQLLSIILVEADYLLITAGPKCMRKLRSPLQRKIQFGKLVEHENVTFAGRSLVVRKTNHRHQFREGHSGRIEVSRLDKRTSHSALRKDRRHRKESSSNNCLPVQLARQGRIANCAWYGVSFGQSS